MGRDGRRMENHDIKHVVCKASSVMMKLGRRPHKVVILIERVIMESKDIMQTVCRVYSKMMKNLGWEPHQVVMEDHDIKQVVRKSHSATMNNLGWFGPRRPNPMRMFSARILPGLLDNSVSMPGSIQRFMEVTRGMMGNVQAQQNGLHQLERHVPFPGQL